MADQKLDAPEPKVLRAERARIIAAVREWEQMERGSTSAGNIRAVLGKLGVLLDSLERGEADASKEET